MIKREPHRVIAIAKAKQLVKDLSIEHPSHIDIEAIALARGAFVKEEPIKGADGRLAALGKYGLITIREDIKESGKKRFVAAHELGHYELHRNQISVISCADKSFLEWYTKNYIEVEANFFAAELLMPEDMFKKSVTGKKLSAGLLESLRKTFSVSLTAAAIRFVTVRPEYALVCSAPDHIKWFVINTDWFPLHLNIEGKVHPESMAYEHFQGNSFPQDFCIIEPIAWTDWRVKGKLKELVIPLGKYNQVLSFLFIEEDLD